MGGSDDSEPFNTVRESKPRGCPGVPPPPGRTNKKKRFSSCFPPCRFSHLREDYDRPLRRQAEQQIL
ncbi:Hypothetical protein NTJ_12301 [Nesidiocoris tenuis]|uniref:Uncharacterized protein n=1 Tax=Nesidiocoris tenuis TaxID=355587 RepID=A0ABN7B6K3_9HEMI|nr:Hypothetical protein NTJ_12301 [Nesidiocoris tenuis]